MATDLESLSHEELSRMRNAPEADQELLAPLEHQAFAREYASESPLLALGLLGAIPAYQLGKSLGLIGSRTGASQPGAQMAAGYRGLGQGLAQAGRRGFGALFPSAEAVGPTAPTSDAGTIFASPIDRRGPYFGAPPSPVASLQPTPKKKPAGPGAVGPAGPVIPGFEREFGVINQQVGGAVPHQSTY